jgi:outer membrane protein assembly factor BamB
MLALVLMLSLAPIGRPGALAAGGDLVWQDRFDAGGSGQTARDLAVHGNRVFVVGEVGGASVDALVRAYDTRTGQMQWQDRVDVDAFDLASAVATDGAGVFVSGYVGPFDSLDFIVRAYDAGTGALRWQDRHDSGGGQDYALAIAAHGNRVFATGNFTDAAGSGGLLLRAYDALDGTLLWEDRRLGESFGSSMVRPLAAAGGRVYVVAIAAPPTSGIGIVVRAHDAATGAVLWTDTYTGDGFATSNALTVGEGAVFVAGFDAAPDGGSRAFIRAYHPVSGTLRWQSVRTEPETYYIIQAVATASGFVFAGGNKTGPPDFGFRPLVLAYDAATGAFAWENATGSGDIFSLAAHANRVFAAGQAEGTAFDTDFLVRAYDARTGRIDWEDTHDMAGSFDGALAVAVKGDRAFTAGVAYDSDGVPEFLVRTYDAK